MMCMYVQNFLRNLIVKEYCKSVYICRRYDHKSSVLFFFDSQCTYYAVSYL